MVHRYSGDTRAVALFHYLLSGDDRLMRQAITNFAASVTPEGLTKSRFPSQVPQVIAGFSLYWILQVCDHHLFFGDKKFSRSLVPRIDGVFEFFDSHVEQSRTCQRYFRRCLAICGLGNNLGGHRRTSR